MVRLFAERPSWTWCPRESVFFLLCIGRGIWDVLGLWAPGSPLCLSVVFLLLWRIEMMNEETSRVVHAREVRGLGLGCWRVRCWLRCVVGLARTGFVFTWKAGFTRCFSLVRKTVDGGKAQEFRPRVHDSGVADLVPGDSLWSRVADEVYIFLPLHQRRWIVGCLVWIVLCLWDSLTVVSIVDVSSLLRFCATHCFIWRARIAFEIRMC